MNRTITCPCCRARLAVGVEVRPVREAGRRLTARSLAEAKRMRVAGATYSAIARELGVDRSSVSRALRGITWTDRKRAA